FFCCTRPLPRAAPLPYTTLFRSESSRLISPCSIFSTSCSSSSSDCSNWATGEASRASFFGMRQVCAVGRGGSTRIARCQPAQGQATGAKPVLQCGRQGHVSGSQHLAAGIDQQGKV